MSDAADMIPRSRLNEEIAKRKEIEADLAKFKVDLTTAQTAAAEAETLRATDRTVELEMVTQEPFPPYSPPAMADHFLTGRDGGNLHCHISDIGWAVEVRANINAQGNVVMEEAFVIRNVKPTVPTSILSRSNSIDVVPSTHRIPSFYALTQCRPQNPFDTPGPC
jgi:hypothetical protein